MTNRHRVARDVTPDEAGIEAAVAYLSEGGLGETEQGIRLLTRLGHTKQQIDADHALALCRLAGEALRARAQAGRRIEEIWR